MNFRTLFLLSSVAIASVGCDNSDKKQDDEVIAERFIHVYGYDVPKEEWLAKNYPGKVITTHRNGVTLTTHFEDGLMHGERVRSYPHSQTVEARETFQRGMLVKRIDYDIRGIPTQEVTFKSPTNTKTLSWYTRGAPRSVEELINGQLTYAEYFNPANETESRVENGTGTKTVRDGYGELVGREVFDNFELVQKETFFANGTPKTSEFYKAGQLHGPRIVYSELGDPLTKEHYLEGELHGLASYYQNGCKYLEVPYSFGMKEGVEKHFIDGETLAEETEWHGNYKHGPSVVFYDGIPTTSWFYNDELVSHSKFDQLTERSEEILRLDERGYAR